MKPARILVVEDEMIIARELAAQLSLLGYEPVGHAVRGEQAVALAGELLPDLVLMDIQLAGDMDGIAAAELIRCQFDLPVIFITAFFTEETMSRAKITEPYGYILKPYTEREIHTVIQIALYKHQVDRRLRDDSLQMRALTRRAHEMQEAECRRIALELHDEIGQSLTAIKINLQTRQKYEDQTPEQLNAENLAIVERLLQQVRSLTLSLHPSVLDDLGLLPALRWMATQVATRSGFVVSVNAGDSETSKRLPPQLESACYRIAQEALTNIARHAKATRVEIDLAIDASGVTLKVWDDGCGFDTENKNSRGHVGASLGLIGMHERARLLGGDLTIESQPGHGCTVRLRSPL